MDPKAIRASRKPYCEVCFRTAFGDPHHVRTRGAGGPDIKENLIQLCWDCHYVKVPAGKLPRHFLFAMIAKREGISVKEIEKKVYR